MNDFIIISANIEIPISKKISTTHITFIVNIYNMWWKGLGLNFIVPTKIQNLPNWLRGPTSRRSIFKSPIQVLFINFACVVIKTQKFWTRLMVMDFNYLQKFSAAVFVTDAKDFILSYLSQQKSFLQWSLTNSSPQI